MAAGKPYDEALEIADRAERKQRRRSGDMKKLTPASGACPTPQGPRAAVEKTRKRGERLDRGRPPGAQRLRHRLHRRRPRLRVRIRAENEVWIDDDIAEAERGYVLVHELHERRLMATGWTYDKAHADSSRLELRCRRHPDELHDALAAEGWA